MLRQGEPFQQRGRARERRPVARRQPGEVAGEPLDAAAASALEQPSSPSGGPHPPRTPVLRIGGALDQAVALESLHEPGDGRRADLLGGGQVADPDRSGEHDDGERGEAWRAEPGPGVLRVQPAEHVDGGGVDPVGEPGIGVANGVRLTGTFWVHSLLSQANYIRVHVNRAITMTTPATNPDTDIRPSAIGQIAITAEDLDRAITFYRDALGLPFLFQAPPGLAFFRCGEVRLMIALPEEPDGERHASILYFRVEDIAAAHRALAARGVRFVDEPHVVHRDGERELWMTFFRDSEANLMALMSEPAATGS